MAARNLADKERSQQRVTGEVTKVDCLDRPDDGARLEVVPTGQRNPHSFQSRAGISSSLKIWKGQLTPLQAQACEPFSHFDTIPPLQCREELSA